jgi:hypothetical protein
MESVLVNTEALVESSIATLACSSKLKKRQNAGKW